MARQACGPVNVFDAPAGLDDGGHHLLDNVDSLASGVAAIGYVSPSKPDQPPLSDAIPGACWLSWTSKCWTAFSSVASKHHSRPTAASTLAITVSETRLTSWPSRLHTPIPPIDLVSEWVEAWRPLVVDAVETSAGAAVLAPVPMAPSTVSRRVIARVPSIGASSSIGGIIIGSAEGPLGEG